jgi:hypothetical protein
MQKLVYVLIVLTTVAAAAAAVSRSGLAQSAPNAAGDAPAAFNPMMGALMNMFIQPRHAKLGLAGQSANWILAGYEVRQLKQALMKVSAAVPRWKGLPVPDLFDAALTEPLTALETAVRAADARQFGDAYGQLTAGCNACHATTDHSYIVLRTPDVSEYPDQEFKSRQ